MTNSFALFPLLVFLFSPAFYFGSGAKQFDHPEIIVVGHFPTPTPIQHADVESLNLSSNTVTLPCNPGSRTPSESCNDNKVIGVSTKAHDPANHVVVYNYTVSGGRIVGSGANVQWDLNGARAGTYTITAGVDNGSGIFGKTQSKTVTVRECPDCGHACVCPALSLAGPSGLTNPGDTMTFTANLHNEVTSTYNWTVTAGTIESGQGTPSITVRTSSEMAGNNVTATVNIGGLDPGCGCVTSVSETAGVASHAAGFFHGDIKGRVLSRPSGKPVANAQVELIFDGEVKVTKITDSQGRYTFEGVPADAVYSIKASKNGKTDARTIKTKVNESVTAAPLRLKTQ